MGGILEALRANTVMIGLLVGAITPLIISVIQQPTLSTRARKIVALVVSAIVGGVVVLSSESANVGDVLGTIVAVWAASEAFFQKVWRPSGVTDAVENATSPNQPAEPADDPGELERF